jgi:hypothetical protein
MKRPVVGTLSVLALLGLGVFLALHFRDEAKSPDGDASYEGAAARARFMAQFDFALPASADDVHYATEFLDRTQLTFVRFDVPSAELPTLVPEDKRLPGYDELRADPALVQAMSVLTGPQRPWWQVGAFARDGATVVAGQKSGQRQVAQAGTRWRVQLCAGGIGAGAATTMTRVYIAASEEPLGGQ